MVHGKSPPLSFALLGTAFHMDCLHQAYGQIILPSYDLYFVLSMLRCQHETPLDAEEIAAIGVEFVVSTAMILLTQGCMLPDWLAKRNLQHKQPEHLQR